MLLTNGIQDAIGEATAEQSPNPLPFLAGAYADAFLVAVILAVCLVPALFLPRRKVAPVVDPGAMIGH